MNDCSFDNVWRSEHANGVIKYEPIGAIMEHTVRPTRREPIAEVNYRKGAWDRMRKGGCRAVKVNVAEAA